VVPAAEKNSIILGDFNISDLDSMGLSHLLVPIGENDFVDPASDYCGNRPSKTLY
jgi:hypothetical protein